jgi:methyl coenzyme M reductase subunit C
MKKRGLKVQSVSPEVEAQWRVAVDGVYPSIRGRIVPEDIFDKVVSLLKEFRESGAR